MTHTVDPTIGIFIHFVCVALHKFYAGLTALPQIRPLHRSDSKTLYPPTIKVTHQTTHLLSSIRHPQISRNDRHKTQFPPTLYPFSYRAVTVRKFAKSPFRKRVAIVDRSWKFYPLSLHCHLFFLLSYFVGHVCIKATITEI